MGLGLWFISQMLKECRSAVNQREYLELREDYEEYHAKRKVGKMVFDRAERILDWVEPRSTVLDLGGGDGTVAEYLKNHLEGIQIECRDVSQQAIQLSRNRGLNAAYFNLESGNISDLPVSDYILALDVMEHTTNPHLILPGVLSRARKAVVLSFPNSGRLPFRIQLLAGIFPRQSWTHLHFWTGKDFPHFCRQLGLEIISLRTEKPPPGFIPSLLYRQYPNVFCEHLYYLLRGKAE